MRRLTAEIEQAERGIDAMSTISSTSRRTKLRSSKVRSPGNIDRPFWLASALTLSRARRARLEGQGQGEKARPYGAHLAHKTAFIARWQKSLSEL